MDQRPIPKTTKVWPPPDTAVVATEFDVAGLLRKQFAVAGADKHVAAQYADYIASPRYLGSLSIACNVSDPIGIHCGWGNRAAVLREFFAPGAFFLRHLQAAITLPREQRIPQVVLELAQHDPWGAGNFETWCAVDGDRRINHIIDGVIAIEGEFNSCTPPQPSVNAKKVYSAVLRNLVARRVVKPSDLVNVGRCLAEAQFGSLSASSQPLQRHNVADPELLEYWLWNLGGRAYDALHELWLALSDNELAELLRCAIRVDHAIQSWQAQREADNRHQNELQREGAALSAWVNDPANKEAIAQLGDLAEAAGQLAAVRASNNQRVYPRTEDPEERLDDAKNRLIASVPKDRRYDAPLVVERIRKLQGLGLKAAPVHAALFDDGFENLLVHLDDRLSRGGAPKELKAIAAHFGYRLLNRHRAFREYMPGMWSVRHTDALAPDIATMVLKRDSPNAPGPVEARLAEAAIHALADLRELASQSGMNGDDEARYVAWRAEINFKRCWPDFRRFLTLAHQRQSLWSMVKPMLLALLRLNVPCTGADLRYERKVADEDVNWTSIAHELGVRLRYSLDAEQAEDPELQGLRNGMCEFLLKRLLPPKRDGESDTPYETRPVLRVGFLRAIRQLKCNPKGRGHRTIHKLLEIEQDPLVLRESKRAYEAVRRAPAKIDGASARRSLFSAFFLIREAQVRAVGGEVAANAARTWYREARDARNDWRWFNERQSSQS